MMIHLLERNHYKVVYGSIQIKCLCTSDCKEQKTKKCFRNIYAPHGAKFSVEAKPVRSK